ncbi:MAG TPA: 2-C-methyl-D-erythritol 4-phosphate cytidylyltransferase [Vicinamibacteria bacterium]|nr:2-C-methyl-D-erythritol 4-phosphate cytidylyltransferase [Vicinamibacteria bacterium]
MKALAIVVAAGKGERMGGARPKAFLPVAGEAMLLRAARAFDAAETVDTLVVVVPPNEVDAARCLLGPVRKPLLVVPGGERRQDSVLEGMKRAPDGFDGIVLVHDAARPFVEPELIDAVARAAEAHGAAIPIVPLTDTIKRLEAGRVAGTLDRDALAAAQTPQGFRYALLARAYEEADRARVDVTDEAMAVERLGALVATLPGSHRNRKLTTPEDLAWAEALSSAETRA